MAFLEFIELKFETLSEQINSYVKDIYKKSNEVLSSASPYGQLLNVFKEFFQHTILYQKNIVRNLDIDTVSNSKIIRTYSVIAGHNPTRPISANGSIKFSLKTNIDLEDEIYGGGIVIPDKALLRNSTNGLYYSLRVGRQAETYRIKEGTSFYVNIIQGIYEEQTFTGNGLKNQSLSVNVLNIQEIENFEVEVLYNGNSLTIRDSLYDMGRNEYACFIRTGMNGGIDIFFGNVYCGFVPALGSIITVRYLLTDGMGGNILTPTPNDFRFITEVNDVAGNNIKMENLFDNVIVDSLSFGSNGDADTFMKNTIGNVSRNFVLSTAEQYIYHLGRLGMFSKVNVYNTLSDNNYSNDSKIYLYLIPKISNYYSSTVNYFNLPLSIYTLEQYEIDKILTYLQKLGNIQTGVELEVIQPRISKYVLYVYVRKYEGYLDENIKNDIILSVSNYLTTLYRDDRIVCSDIISSIEYVNGVDSVNVSFVSEKNEIYHRKYPTTTDVIGLDPIMGDVVVEKDELALIRGGWSDRNGTYYSESSETNGLGPINVIFVGTTKK